MNVPPASPRSLRESVVELFDGRAELPVPARIAVTRAMSRLAGPERKLISRELAALQSGDDEPLGPDELISAARLANFGATRGEVSAIDAVYWAGRVATALPDNPAAATVAADAFAWAGSDREALQTLRRAAKLDSAKENYGLHMRLGVTEYNARAFEAAAAAYARAVSIRPTAQAHLYLADTQRNLDRVDAARDNYLAALRRDPLLVDALRGYWALTSPDEPGAFDWLAQRMMEARPSPIPVNRWLRPVLWRLLRARYVRHPEDARLHIMLGYTALLRRNFKVARERLTFAYYLPPRRDFRALIGAALAAGLDGDLDATERLVSQAIDFYSEVGADTFDRPLLTLENSSEILSPFIWEPRLSQLPTAEPTVKLLFLLVPGSSGGPEMT